MAQRTQRDLKHTHPKTADSVGLGTQGLKTQDCSPCDAKTFKFRKYSFPVTLQSLGSMNPVILPSESSAHLGGDGCCKAPAETHKISH